MKVGLIHGRFQPFHNGHKFLIDKMIRECDIGVILIGSVDKLDERNPFTLEERKQMIEQIYQKNKKIAVGANMDLCRPYSKSAQWDVVLSSCVLSLTGYLPTTIYAGKEYTVPWKRIHVKIKKSGRYNNLSGTGIRELIREKRLNNLRKSVPKQVFKIIKERF